MAYLKPQAPLQNGDDYVYPITTADQVVATDGTHRLNNELNEIREETAVIESSSTSSHAYAVGKFLTYNGILYRVTTAIAIGDTLTPGTNITATNVGDQLKSLNDSLTPYMCEVLYEVTPGADVTFSGDIIFNKVATNIGGCYSTSTGRFTCPVDGIYLATFSYFSNSNSIQQRATIRKSNFALIQKNGPYGGSISVITYCTAGQYLTAGSSSSTYPLSLFAYSGHNRFCVSLLRAC